MKPAILDTQLFLTGKSKGNMDPAQSLGGLIADSPNVLGFSVVNQSAEDESYISMSVNVLYAHGNPHGAGNLYFAKAGVGNYGVKKQVKVSANYYKLSGADDVLFAIEIDGQKFTCSNFADLQSFTQRISSTSMAEVLQNDLVFGAMNQPWYFTLTAKNATVPFTVNILGFAANDAGSGTPVDGPPVTVATLSGGQSSANHSVKISGNFLRTNTDDRRYLVFYISGDQPLKREIGIESLITMSIGDKIYGAGITLEITEIHIPNMTDPWFFTVTANAYFTITNPGIAESNYYLDEHGEGTVSVYPATNPAYDGALVETAVVGTYQAETTHSVKFSADYYKLGTDDTNALTISVNGANYTCRSFAGLGSFLQSGLPSSVRLLDGNFIHGQMGDPWSFVIVAATPGVPFTASFVGFSTASAAAFTNPMIVNGSPGAFAELSTIADSQPDVAVNSLAWQAYSETKGDYIPIPEDGYYELPSGGLGKLIVSVTTSRFPATQSVASVNINFTKNTTMPDISSLDGTNGKVWHYCYAFKNIGTVARQIKIFIVKQPDGDDRIAIGVEPGGARDGDIAAQAIATAQDIPQNVTFSAPTSPESALDLGVLQPGEFAAWWQRRTLEAGTHSAITKNLSKLGFVII